MRNIVSLTDGAKVRANIRPTQWANKNIYLYPFSQR